MPNDPDGNRGAISREMERSPWPRVICLSREEIREKTASNMTNTGTVSAAKEQSVEFRARDVRLSSDIEDAIEQIERLDLARSRGDAAGRRSNVDPAGEQVPRCGFANLSQRVQCPAKFGHLVFSSRHDLRPRQQQDRDGGRKQGCDRNDEQDSEDGSCSDSEQDQDQDQELGILIERGPVKSQFFSPARSQPYLTTGERSRHLEAGDAFTIDYEKTAERILRDEEYGEKLIACLDQLQDFEKANWSYYSGVKITQNACPANDFAGDVPLSSTVVEGDNTSDDMLLLESVLCGAFQAAQQATDRAETTGRCFDRNPAASGSESRESSRTQSPAAVLFAGSPQPSYSSFSHSPVGSPQIVAASMYRPSQVSFSSSSCSSSSSNQSFGDTPSPKSLNRAAIEPRIEEQFRDDFENFPFWKLDCETGAAPAAPSSSVENNINDDDDDLWSKVVEELVNGLEAERDEVDGPRADGTASSLVNDAYACSNEFQRENSIARGTADAESDAILSWSIPSQRNIPAKEMSSGETRTARTSAAVSIPPYSKSSGKGDGSTVEGNLLPPLCQSTGLGIEIPDLDHTETKRSATQTRDDFEIPKMVACFEARPRRRCNSDRSIIPWPSLNLPSGKASDRLKMKLQAKEVEKAMVGLLKRPVEELAKQDRDGDTTLMCLVGNPDELVRKMAYLVPLVERLTAAPGALAATNNRGEDALYLAAINCPQFPYVAGYLAAAMIEKGIDVSQRLYHTKGDTLIHSIAAQGDSHGETLAELLALTTVQGNAVFDLSKRNYDGRTALHVAIESHEPSKRGIASVATVKLLLKYGADPAMKETRCGDTALHMAVSFACDPALTKVLLSGSSFDLVNATNYNHDTPLHAAAAASSSVPLERQREVCWLLIHAGGQTNLPNRQGKTPLALVTAERKEAIRKIFYKRS